MNNLPPKLNQTLKSLRVAFKWLTATSAQFSANSDYVAYVGVGEYFNRFTKDEWETIPAQIEELITQIEISPTTTAEIVIVKKERSTTRISGMVLENGQWAPIPKDTLLQNLAIAHPTEINTEYVDIKSEFPDCPANSDKTPTASEHPKNNKANKVKPSGQPNSLKQAIEALADIGTENRLYYDLLLDSNYACFGPEDCADMEDFYDMTPCNDAIVRISIQHDGKWITLIAEFKNNNWKALTETETKAFISKYPKMNWLEKFNPEYVSLKDFPVEIPFAT